jgi:hypothetical protein
MGMEDVRAVAALYCLVLCLVAAQRGSGFGMSSSVGVLISLMYGRYRATRRFRCSEGVGLELYSRVAEDVEI